MTHFTFPDPSIAIAVMAVLAGQGIAFQCNPIAGGVSISVATGVVRAIMDADTHRR